MLTNALNTISSTFGFPATTDTAASKHAGLADRLKRNTLAPKDETTLNDKDVQKEFTNSPTLQRKTIKGMLDNENAINANLIYAFETCNPCIDRMDQVSIIDNAARRATVLKMLETNGDDIDTQNKKLTLRFLAYGIIRSTSWTGAEREAAFNGIVNNLEHFTDSESQCLIASTFFGANPSYVNMLTPESKIKLTHALPGLYQEATLRGSNEAENTKRGCIADAITNGRLPSQAPEALAELVYAANEFDEHPQVEQKIVEYAVSHLRNQDDERFADFLFKKFREFNLSSQHFITDTIYARSFDQSPNTLAVLLERSDAFPPNAQAHIIDQAVALLSCTDSQTLTQALLDRLTQNREDISEVFTGEMLNTIFRRHPDTHVALLNHIDLFANNQNLIVGAALTSNRPALIAALGSNFAKFDQDAKTLIVAEFGTLSPENQDLIWQESLATQDKALINRLIDDFGTLTAATQAHIVTIAPKLVNDHIVDTVIEGNNPVLITVLAANFDHFNAATQRHILANENPALITALATKFDDFAQAAQRYILANANPALITALAINFDDFAQATQRYILANTNPALITALVINFNRFNEDAKLLILANKNQALITELLKNFGIFVPETQQLIVSIAPTLDEAHQTTIVNKAFRSNDPALITTLGTIFAQLAQKTKEHIVTSFETKLDLGNKNLIWQASFHGDKALIKALLQSYDTFKDNTKEDIVRLALSNNDPEVIEGLVHKFEESHLNIKILIVNELQTFFAKGQQTIAGLVLKSKNETLIDALLAKRDTVGIDSDVKETIQLYQNKTAKPQNTASAVPTETRTLITPQNTQAFSKLSTEEQRAFLVKELRESTLNKTVVPNQFLKYIASFSDEEKDDLKFDLGRNEFNALSKEVKEAFKTITI